MSSEQDIRDALRDWIASESGKVSFEELTDQTAIFSSGILKSFHVTDLILLIEELGERSISIEDIRPGVFHDIDTIYANFFSVAKA